ncbi:Mfa1 family fimbria major subunit [Sphingobacterium spiritivorum]|uniref:Mfa1 family fimbria major subunit n=1 Tax=Sphingobacterium spiritivorum TaxID=258 RepID=UPI0019197BB6|nr:Mfa1 family fimbria major subunit [Sphingobacterium spiritivorum]QQT24251.1 Mfa1 family fimbria major subunit [Sphingobacterium spiritivorum]
MKKYAIIALAGLTLASCKKQGGEPSPVVPGDEKDARVTLNITPSANIGTYASTVGSDNGTANESKITTIDVFLYNEDGGLTPAGYKRFSGAEANLSSPKTIETKTGRKRIYIGINLPQSLADQLKANFSAMQSPYVVNMAQLATANDGVMMFNQAVASLTIKEGNDPDNKISIPVARLLAKAGILQGANLSLNTQGGAVSDLQYTVGQRNKQIFIGNLFDFKDANWTFIDRTANAAGYNAAFEPVLSNEYKPVDAKGTATNALKTVYIPENTSEKSEHTQLTYIQIRSKFTPTTVSDGTLPASGTFYVVFGQVGSNLYMHQLYFASKTEADKEAASDKYKVTKTVNGVATTVSQSAVLTYENGLCYYRLYLNEDQAAGANKAGILRNTFFNAQITKINGLGTPKEGQVPGEPGTPGNPGGGVTPTNPVDPEKPIVPGNVDANIEATISITPWKLITSEHEI